MSQNYSIKASTNVMKDSPYSKCYAYQAKIYFDCNLFLLKLY